MTPPPGRASGGWHALWGVLAVAATLVPLRGVFTTSRLFFLRDLHAYFWPHYLWLRDVMRAGALPLWDPNPGLGYASVADPALQAFFPPTLALRLLLPAVLGFNVAVALPFPLAAAGMLLFLGRRLPPPAAALGALAYAASGPLLSTSSCTNLAWTAAFIPWIMASVDALAGGATPKCLAASSLLFAGAALAGEPVVFAGTVALAIAYAAVAAGNAGPGAARGLRAAVRVIGSAGAGLALAAVQMLPLWDASRRSIRGAGLLLDTWSLHPLRLAELLLPGLFGDYFGPAGQISPWIWPLNSGREPYLFSLYVGPGILVLAWCAMAAVRRRFVLFWAAAGLLALLGAMGEHAAVYSWLRANAGPLRILRYPEKYVVFTAFVLAVLTAQGWHGLSLVSRAPWRRAAFAALPPAALLLAAALLLLDPLAADHAARALAGSLRMPFPEAAAARLLADLQSRLPRLVALLVATSALVHLAASSWRGARLARFALLALVTADLLTTNAHLNPAMDAGRLGPPPWLGATRAHPHDRVFISQDLFGDGAPDPDHPPRLARGALPLPQARALYTTALPLFPTPWSVREALSADLTGLRPREYLTLLEQYDRSDRAGRTRLLQRLGTRYFIGPRPPSAEARVLMRFPNLAPLALYENPGAAPRVSLVPAARVEAGVAAQIAGLADPLFDPAAHVWVADEPVPAGSPRPPATDGATIVSERPDRIVVRAGVPRSGAYLLLLDAYDPHWSAEVDGGRAELLRANGVFRAVRLEAGQHLVVFAYRPRPFYLGAAISGAAGLMLIAVLLRGGRPPGSPEVTPAATAPTLGRSSPVRWPDRSRRALPRDP